MSTIKDLSLVKGVTFVSLSLIQNITSLTNNQYVLHNSAAMSDEIRLNCCSSMDVLHLVEFIYLAPDEPKMLFSTVSKCFYSES